MPPTRFSPIHRGNRSTRRRGPGRITVEPAIQFGGCCVLPRRRQLLVDDVPVELGTRAFDILLALIDAGGLLVTKEELFNRVWPHRIVEENNLHSQMSALRKALGADGNLIQTEFGRGYRLTAAVRTSAASNACHGIIRQDGRRDGQTWYGW
jgi:DNA-binding winged helix-turn-helix (wHTH) protein